MPVAISDLRRLPNGDSPATAAMRLISDVSTPPPAATGVRQLSGSALMITAGILACSTEAHVLKGSQHVCLPTCVQVSC